MYKEVFQQVWEVKVTYRENKHQQRKTEMGGWTCFGLPRSFMWKGRGEVGWVCQQPAHTLINTSES